MAVPSRSPLRPLHAPGTVPAPALGGLDLLRGEPRPAGAVGERGAPQKLPGPPFPQQPRLVLVLRGHSPGVRGHRGMLSPPGAVPSQALSPPRCSLPLSPLSPASPSSCPLHVLSPLYPSAVPSLLSPMSPLGVVPAVPTVPSRCCVPAVLSCLYPLSAVPSWCSVPDVPSRCCPRCSLQLSPPRCPRCPLLSPSRCRSAGSPRAAGPGPRSRPLVRATAGPAPGLGCPRSPETPSVTEGTLGTRGGTARGHGGVWRGQRGDTEQRWRGLGGDEVGIERGRGAGTWWGQRGDMEGHKETRRDIRGHRRTQEKGEGHNGTRRDTGECGGTQRGYRGTQRDTEGHRGHRSSHQEQAQDPPAQAAAGAGAARRVQHLGGGDTSRGHPQLAPQQPQLHVGDTDLGLRGHRGDTKGTGVG